MFERLARGPAPKGTSLFQRILCRLFRWEDIRKDGSLYLRRWLLLRHSWGHIYFHRIDRPDEDRHPHCHPWNSYILILKGGYRERVWPVPENSLYFVDRAHWPFSFRKMKAEHTHMIRAHPKGRTWSLLFCGKHKRKWGFWVNGDWVYYKMYSQLLKGDSGEQESEIQGKEEETRREAKEKVGEDCRVRRL